MAERGLAGSSLSGGSRIVDANGNPVVLTGLSWFGLETASYAPHGLWARSLDSLLDQIVELGFNTIRLPYCNQLFDPTSLPNGMRTSISLRLFSRAPSTCRHFPFPPRRFSGMGTCSLPERYAPVSEAGLSMIASTGPSATT